jgi:hypothetical protein
MGYAHKGFSTTLPAYQIKFEMEQQQDTVNNIYF